MTTMKTMATMKSYENKCAMNYSIITNNNWNDAYHKQLTKHDTNDDVDTLHLHFNGRVAYMHWDCTHLCSIVCNDTRTSHGSRPERFHTPSMAIHPWPSTWHTLLDSPLHFLLLLMPPVCHRLPLPPRAVPWAPLHQGHGKPALLRCRRELGHPERLHIL